jgi:hypothetical protein
VLLEQKIDRDECGGADEQRGRRASEAGVPVRRLEQLERDGDDERARGEREHPGGQLRRRRPEAAERSSDDERSPADDGIEEGVKHGNSISLCGTA